MPHNTESPPIARLGREVRKVYAITTLFTERRITEYDAICESVDDEGQPDWKAVRVWHSHPEDPRNGYFIFLREDDFFFDKGEAVAFAKRALRAHAAYVQTFFSRLRSEQEWADLFQNRTTEWADQELLPKSPSRKKSKRSRSSARIEHHPPKVAAAGSNPAGTAKSSARGQGSIL